MVLFKESLFGHSALVWMRTDETPPQGEFLASSQNFKERADEMTAQFFSFLENMSANIDNALGVAPLVKTRFQISGSESADFGDNIFNPQFLEIKDHLGMPSGLVQNAAQLIFGLH